MCCELNSARILSLPSINNKIAKKLYLSIEKGLTRKEFLLLTCDGLFKNKVTAVVSRDNPAYSKDLYLTIYLIHKFPLK
ncbi:MAG: hypothetical protein DRP29_07585 [Thermodesulfobacteriota bacterium]|nr:MAG: hypothetical protein DRP29_07585 [Thermodesulfobacteriota bacterium]